MNSSIINIFEYIKVILYIMILTLKQKPIPKIALKIYLPSSRNIPTR